MLRTGQELVKKCPAIKDWELTTYTVQYSYRYGGAAPVEKTVHVFLVVATDRERERDGYRWVSLSNISSEFSYGEGAIHEMKQTMNAVGLNDLGVGTFGVQYAWQLSPEARA